MNGEYDHGVYRGYIIKGDLPAALEYIGKFPEKADLRRKCASLFEEGKYLAYDVEKDLQEILLAYQQCFRETFYLRKDAGEAEKRLQNSLATLAGGKPGASIDELEEGPVSGMFQGRGFHFLGGRTSGYYGPYIWRTEELKRYAVELPEGVREYPVKFLDGFVFQGWMDYISFGIVRTGGWSNGDGLICCVRTAYDLESESFMVSLLKHEAQHAADLERYKGISSEDLEYRAKLVELIYSRERELLSQFAGQASGADKANGHARAAARIAAGFERLLGRKRDAFPSLPRKEVQAAAGELFAESCRETAEKYGQEGTP